jgi:hypothetical protein
VVHRHTVTVTITRTVTTTTTPAAKSGCTGDQLSGTFKEAPGGGGAGQIEYVLSLKNTSQTSCTLSGPPSATLLDASGSPLPTHVIPSSSSDLGSTAFLGPSGTAKTTARFSPDVPGKGDSQSGSCQPKAYTLQVRPDGGGTVAAAIKPPTSVCEQGTLAFGPYVAN